MIASLRGILLKKNSGSVIVEVSGVGWEVFVTPSTSASLPDDAAAEVRFFISESTAMYGGATTLYGFQSQIEKDTFELLRTMPGTGAKKALEYLDKITKSVGDFRKAVIDKDVPILSTLFGFRKPTAEKLISNLKDKIAELKIGPMEKRSSRYVNTRAEAVAVLVALGYRESQAKTAVDESLDEMPYGEKVEEVVKDALKRL